MFINMKKLNSNFMLFPDNLLLIQLLLVDLNPFYIFPIAKENTFFQIMWPVHSVTKKGKCCKDKRKDE